MIVIFLGLLFTDNLIKNREEYSKKNLQMAPHVFQSNVLQGLESNEVDVRVLSIPPIGSFPQNCKKLFFKKEKWGKCNLQISYLNLPVIKWHMQKKKLIAEVKRIIKEKGNEDVSIIAYSTYIPFLETIKNIKKKYPSIKSNLIVTDCIPGRGDMDKYMTKSAIKRGTKVINLSKYVDSFSLLTKYLANTLEIGNKPYAITECISNENQKLATIKSKNEKICFYAGSVSKEFGIDTLVEAFLKIDDAQLWICGGGNLVEYVKEVAEKHKNIKYLGFVSREEVSNLTDKCDYLVNPRVPTGTYTKYSFPSKTAEYMMSGKPTIMYKLEGVPDSYDEYLNYVKETDSNMLKEELERIFNIDYKSLQEKALRARNFLISNNSSYKQAGKILEMLKR